MAKINNLAIPGGEGVQIPRRGLTENFNMAKINNLAIPGGSGPPVPPLDPPMMTCELPKQNIRSVFA